MNNANKKILIVGMNYIGDSLFCTPLIRSIKNHYKDSVIDITGGACGVEILSNNPNIRKYILRPKEKTCYKSYIETIQNEKYDIGFATNTAFYAAIDLYKAGIPIRVGLNSEMRGIFLTHRCAWKKYSRHIVDGMLAPLNLLGIETLGTNLEIFLTDEELSAGVKKMEAIDAYECQNALFMHAGATRLSKRYPIESFSSLIRSIDKELTVPIILVGGKEDIPLSNAIKEHVKTRGRVYHDFTGMLSIRELASVLKCGHAFIGGDSAPLHIANAMGLHTLGIYGDTSPQIYGVRGERAVNVSGHPHCKSSVSLRYCKFIKRGCSSIDCLKKLKPESLLPILFDFYTS